MPWLFAQTAENIPVWAQIAGGIATAGFTAWYAWYTTTVTIPKMQELHSDLIKKVVSDFREDSREQREDSKQQRDLESKRAQTSAELARSGHMAMTQVTRAVDDLRAAIDRHGVDVGDRKATT